MDLSSVFRVEALAAAPVAPVEAPAQQREVIRAVRALNGSEMFGHENELQFQMNREVHRMVIQVVNRQTREVVSQIPPEYLLRLAADLVPPETH